MKESLQMLQVFNKSAAPKVINAQEERPLAEWQQLYPDLWLLLEVTAEADGEPCKGRLIAVAQEDTDLVSLWQECGRQGKITAMLHGVYTEAGPTVVA
jgi:hypothetical protein